MIKNKYKSDTAYISEANNNLKINIKTILPNKDKYINENK